MVLQEVMPGKTSNAEAAREAEDGSTALPDHSALSVLSAYGSQQSESPRSDAGDRMDHSAEPDQAPAPDLATAASSATGGPDPAEAAAEPPSHDLPSTDLRSPAAVADNGPASLKSAGAELAAAGAAGQGYGREQAAEAAEGTPPADVQAIMGKLVAFVKVRGSCLPCPPAMRHRCSWGWQKWGDLVEPVGGGTCG